uniref:Cytochrome b6/f complex subunit VI n=1 Tax=Laurus azorica TaxID=136121 RepID=A0A411LWA6_9MAGN|nr:cytochrome b6/f complex subunit VI [Laurus azorica]
MTSYSSHGGAK